MTVDDITKAAAWVVTGLILPGVGAAVKISRDQVLIKRDVQALEANFTEFKEEVDRRLTSIESAVKTSATIGQVDAIAKDLKAVSDSMIVIATQLDERTEKHGRKTV